MPMLLRLFSAPVEYVVGSLIVGVFIYWKHRENIRRIMSGTESRFSSQR